MVVLTLHLPYTSIHLFLMPLGVGGFSYLSSLKKTFPLPKLQPLNPHWKPTAPMRAVTLMRKKKLSSQREKETYSMNVLLLVLGAIPEAEEGLVMNKEVLGLGVQKPVSSITAMLENIKFY